MSQDQPRPAFTMLDVDFEALYQGRAPVAGQGRVFETPPWDIGEAQPFVVALERSGVLGGEILDVGCGLGENALHLATRGHRVTGVDVSPTAVRKASARAAELGVDVEFLASDATVLAELSAGRFDTVLDSALYHCFDAAGQRAYAAALHRVTRPGARLHLFCSADVPGQGFRLPHQVSEQDLRDNLGAHWEIEELALASYTTALTREALAAMANRGALASVSSSVDPTMLKCDEKGRVTEPVWQVRAVRR